MVVAVARRLVDAAQDLDVERVGDVADDDAEELASAPAQRASHHVRPVAELLGGDEDALARRHRGSARRSRDR